MKSHFKPLKSQSNLWLGTLFASGIFMSALLFFEGISASRGPTSFYYLKFPLFPLGTRCAFKDHGAFFYGSVALWLSSRDVDFIKQIKGKNMSEWNIKARLSSVFLVARRHRLHLLTASQRESEEITKTGFYFTPSSSLTFPFQCGHDGCSVTDLICLFHLAL